MQLMTFAFFCYKYYYSYSLIAYHDISYIHHLKIDRSEINDSFFSLLSTQIIVIQIIILLIKYQQKYQQMIHHLSPTSEYSGFYSQPRKNISRSPLSNNGFSASPKKLVRRIRYKDPEINPKDKLVIVSNNEQDPNNSMNKKIESEYLEADRTIMYFSEQKPLASRENRFDRNLKNILFLQSQETEAKSSIPKQLSKKLKPILNEAKVRELGTEKKEVKQQSTRKIGSLRMTKDLFNIKKRINKGSNLRILIPSDREQYYRLGEQKQLCNIFNIHSFEDPLNCIIDQTSTSFLRGSRRGTEPNLDTEELINRKIRNQSLLSNLDIKPLNYQEVLGQQMRIAKSKKIRSKLKQLPNIPALNKKNIILSRKFKVPFQTYYYRDFLWKINFTNELSVQAPLQYEHRLKAYIGKGNNSCMVRGLISRRYWFAFTDKIEEANFVWTQLKDINYFTLQKTMERRPLKQENTQQYLSSGIFNINDKQIFSKYWEVYMRAEQNSEQRLLGRLKYFKGCTIIKGNQIREGKMQNHLKNNYVIGNKKALFKTMCQYYNSKGVDPFDYIPITFHITEGSEDPNFLAFQRYYHKKNKGRSNQKETTLNMWIVKPGENSNRGNGIKVCHELNQIKNIVKNKQKWQDGSPKTYIVQAYIQKPLLYKKRKFDFRHYIVVTCINGCKKGYWFADGYVRTTSSEYKINVDSSAVHLTNDAIQKTLPEYGKYEKGNKLSYDQIDCYIQKNYPKKSFYGDIYPKMKAIGTDIIKASAFYLDEDSRQNNFEVFGLDFMVDNTLKLWLIEVNSNPCLELSCPLLSQLIPNLVQNVLQVTMDALFPPPVRYTPKFRRYFENVEEMNKLELVFDERVESGCRGDASILDTHLLCEEDDTFEDDGEEWEEDS